MKLFSIDILCASQASTAIRLPTTTMDLQQQQKPPSSSSSSSSSSSAAHLGGTRAIDRHNPIIRETTTSRLSASSIPIPCTSDHPPPLAPIPYKQLHQKPARKSTSKQKVSGRKSDVGEGEKIGGRKSSFGKRDFVINGPDSSRYLLGEMGLVDLASDFEPGGLELVSSVADGGGGGGGGGGGKNKAPQTVEKTEESSASSVSNPKPLNSSSSSSSSRSPNQEVVLRVSLHCKGCEGKVRKHISRMQGVTSFNIDFAAKKVTVVGDVTPLEVLSSISKVKTAQLWTPPTPSSLPAASSNFSEIKKSSKALAVGI
ncbi:hypothetical protein Vadar_015328 [Vaccinium darrowii]|uniref:Uncharacterized protein n=1 Tax=Vaccinium darrowii TaxID=229202 RepID=A0ACB7ZK22_9ERIC|nr:hypothetical protein Vadar_015328 [Vaccinium darrowii]